MSRRALRLLGIATVLVSTVGGCLVAGGSAGAAARRSTWYVDCSAHQNGVGSRSRPLDDLQAASQVTLGPGDRLLLRRGVKCTGMLAPHGGGSRSHPVVIGSYGPGRTRAEIDGAGKVDSAVWLADMSYTTVESLELTNAGDSTQLHRGLYFTSDHQVVRGITIRNLLVQHVDSLDTFSGGKTGGGIVGEALSTTGRFSNVLIEHNQVRDVSRQGITVHGSKSSTRPPATRPWPQATTGLVIRRNVVARVQGDGIVPLGTDGAVVERNVVEEGNLAGYDFASANRNCAVGIWAWNADNTVIQRNVVSHMHYGPSTTPGSLNGCDGEAFDVDSNQDGTVIQDNLSYDNAGGFVLLCTNGGTADAPNPTHRADVRYNLSVDDGATFDPTPCSGDFNPAVNNLDGIRLYDNTIVAPTPRVTLELNSPLTGYLGNFVFQDNIVDATSQQAGSDKFTCGTSCSHNLFHGMPAPSTATTSQTGNPRFVDAARRGARQRTALGFRLRKGSPAIDAGTSVPAGVIRSATRDYFGRKISKPPTIGFSEG